MSDLVGIVPDDAPSSAPTDPACVITDTGELRWFARGALPGELRSWFDRGGRTGAVEQRRDTYRYDRRSDVGLKLRSGERLELKVRQSVDDLTVTLNAHLTGQLEAWRRWSPADGLAAPTLTDRWIVVAKTIVRRRILADGVELVVEPQLPRTGFCDIELADLQVAGQPWWSLALTAYGPAEIRPTHMRTAWRVACTDAPPPDACVSALGEPQGYPSWLAARLASGTEPDAAGSMAAG